jgi:hypothetical protein
MGLKKIIIFAIICLIILQSASAAVVGVSPSIVRVNRMLKGGYAETSMIVTTSTEYAIGARFIKEGDIKDWITLDPKDEKFTFSYSKPYSYTLIIQPPEDAKNGNYTGLLKVRTDELATVEEGAGSSVIAEIAILIYVEVVGEEIIQCRAGAISVYNSEIGTPFSIKSTVHNDGNVRLRPEVRVDVYDQYMTKVVFTNTFLGEQILPTKSKEIVKEVNNNLAVGQYFADIYLKDCGVSKRTTFDVVEKGGIADSGELIGIRSNEVIRVNEPTPILPLFHNTGSRKVIAQFKGEVRNLKTDKIVQVLESDQLEVAAGDSTEFILYFTPKQAADYQVSGRVIYNNKITFNEQSKIIKVVQGDVFQLSWALYLIFYLIIGLVILILIGKIRKAQKKKKRF